MNQLFVYVRNSGFDKLKAMILENEPRSDGFPRKCDISNARDQQGHSFLHWAALGGDLDFCKWAVEEVGIPADCATFNGQTSLMWAAIRGHVQVVRYFLDCGADPRKKDSLGATALLLTIQHKR